MSISTERPTSVQTAPRRPRRPFLLIGVGVALVLAGAFGLMLAAAYAPTLSNALTQEWVLKPAAYTLLRLISFASLGGGLLLATVGVIRHAQSSTSPNGQPR